MAEVRDFYRTLLRSQRSYLIAFRELAVAEPVLCSQLFGLKISNVSSLASYSAEEWERFVRGVRHWVLKPKKDFADNNLFDYWLSNIRAESSIAEMMNNRILFGKKHPSGLTENTFIKNISQHQFSIIQDICVSVYSNPSFTKGLLFLTDDTVRLIGDNYFNSNKFHFCDPFLPIFVLNEAVADNRFFSLGEKAYRHIEHRLFSIVN